MSVSDIAIGLIHVPNPSSNGSLAWNIVQGGPAFSVSSNIRTLSSRGAERGGIVVGLLYVPKLEESDPCFNASRTYFPANATQSFIPNSLDWRIVALAPWISPTCNLAFLNAARPQYPKALIFYRPDNNTNFPSSTDPYWDFGIGDRWASNNDYPVYAIPSSSGQVWMDQISMYSGNIASAPSVILPLVNGVPTTDYLRFEANIQVGVNVNLPSLWDFLLIAIACLAAIMGVMSLIMHCLQIYRRRSLRRRVMSGEIDLDTLGVKRLTVPQDLLDKMPLYIFEESTAKDLAQDLAPQQNAVDAMSSGTQADVTTMASKTAYSQLTCAICLDDFKVNETQIREMPCKHIFHPECIDDFLLKNSSLCPLCKTNALPKGYCPRIITNSMVRRDRIYRSQHGQRPWFFFHRGGGVEAVEMSAIPRSAQIAARRNSDNRAISRIRDAITRIHAPQAQESEFAAPSEAPAEENSTVDIGRSTPSRRRREWARQRALSLLGDPQAVAAPRQSQSEASPNPVTRAWRRAFPGFQ